MENWSSSNWKQTMWYGHLISWVHSIFHLLQNFISFILFFVQHICKYVLPKNANHVYEKQVPWSIFATGISLKLYIFNFDFFESESKYNLICLQVKNHPDVLFVINSHRNLWIEFVGAEVLLIWNQFHQRKTHAFFIRTSFSQLF